LNELVKNKIQLKKFEEELTPERALELVQSSMGSKVFDLIDQDLSDHAGYIVLDVLKFEQFLRKSFPQFFGKPFISLESIVTRLYGDKISICIKKLL